MCLAIPGKIVKIKDGNAIVDYGPEQRQASLGLIDCSVGDYVVVNSGFVIQKISKDDAEKAIEVISKMGDNIAGGC